MLNLVQVERTQPTQTLYHSNSMPPKSPQTNGKKVRPSALFKFPTYKCSTLGTWVKSITADRRFLRSWYTNSIIGGLELGKPNTLYDRQDTYTCKQPNRFNCFCRIRLLVQCSSIMVANLTNFSVCGAYLTSKFVWIGLLIYWTHHHLLSFTEKQ